MKLKASELGELAREIARLRARIRKLRKDVAFYRANWRDSNRRASLEREAKVAAEQERDDLLHESLVLRESLEEATATLRQLIANHRTYRDRINTDDWSDAHLRNMALLDQLLKDADADHADV
jgi:uncharacterized coiled-coil DUF342 family protein